MKAIDQDLVPTLPRFIIPCAQLIVVAVLYIMSYYPVLVSLVREWYEHENFSYGFLIPIIAGYLIWQERRVFGETTIAPTAWGALSLLGAVLIGLIGDAAAEPFVSRLSFVAGVGALFHLFFGWSCVRRLALPLVYLFLMVPPPYVVVKEVSYHLRMFDAQVAANLLQAAGIPVYRDAYFLHLPNIVLEVADVCSGIASLFAMLALGVIYVYYLPARRAAKLVVGAGIFLFPVIANLFRIFLVGVSVYYYGPIMLGAFFHHFTGTFTFLLSVAMLLVLGEHCRRAYPENNGHANAQVVANTGDRNGKQEWRSYPFVIAILVLGFAFLMSNGVVFPRATLPHGNIADIAGSLGPYRESADEWPGRYSDANAEKSLSRVYSSPLGPPIETFVGYLSGQFATKRLNSPKLVFPSGWEYADMGQMKIPMLGGKQIDAIWLVVKKNQLKRIVLYWYQVGDKSFAGDLRHRFELIWNRFIHGRTDSAVARMATPIRESESAEQARERLASFSAYLYPEILRVLQ